MGFGDNETSHAPLKNPSLRRTDIAPRTEEIPPSWREKDFYPSEPFSSNPSTLERLTADRRLEAIGGYSRI